MKKIICLAMIAIMLIVFGAVTVSASETVTELEAEETVLETATETESVTEDEPEIVIDKEDASEIIDLIENSSDKSDVILSLMNKYGCSEEDAEAILEAFVALGDKYLGSNEAWIGFKKDIQEDTQFWVMVIMCIATAIAIVLGVFVLLAKTNPTMRRAMFGITDTLKLSKQQLEANIQTLANIKDEMSDCIPKNSYLSATPNASALKKLPHLPAI